MKKIILSLMLLGLLSTQQGFAAESVWKDIQTTILNKQTISEKQSDPSKSLKHFRKLSLNELLLKQQLSESSLFSRSANNVSAPTKTMTLMDIPLPNGGMVRVSLERTQVMAPELAEKFPSIETWKATGADGKGISGRVDFTHYGFHAMLTMVDGDTVFVERETLNSAGIYRSFSKRENDESFSHKFECKVHGKNDIAATDLVANSEEKRVAARQASPLIRYRLAVAATGEYTRFHGNVSNALSAIVTTINRVNGINERDLGITFQLIPEETSLIYTNPATDPYTNGDGPRMLAENADSLSDSNVLGISRFDVGHVFTQGNPSGLAVLGSACDNSLDLDGDLVKAQGLTGSPTPQGDAFDVDFVIHELGHQLGATHTFDSETLSCGGGNRTGQSAVEPGGGSTIMAYAGICGSNDLQQHSDAVYHVFSISQIIAYTRNGFGSSCGSGTGTSNQDPVPNAKQDMTIPINTPFLLSGSGTDPDSDSLTYSWEQVDFDKDTSSDVDFNTGKNAIIRSLLPTSSNQRFIPRLNDIFSNRFLRGECLPASNRALNFALTTRDGRGGIESDVMRVNVADGGGAFKLTSHTTRCRLGVSQQTRVNWDVAGTTSSPISCASVDISLVEANGNSVVLRNGTSNDGTEDVTIPANALGLNGARIMVACSRSGSTFFNISLGDLTIVNNGNGDADSICNNATEVPRNTVCKVKESSDGGGSFNYLLLLLALGLLLYKSNGRIKKQGQY